LALESLAGKVAVVTGGGSGIGQTRIQALDKSSVANPPPPV
jgi:NADP-dependent 3-hydroxy acid dehydrogenase YdfG